MKTLKFILVLVVLTSCSVGYKIPTGGNYGIGDPTQSIRITHTNMYGNDLSIGIPPFANSLQSGIIYTDSTKWHSEDTLFQSNSGKIDTIIQVHFRIDKNVDYYLGKEPTPTEKLDIYHLPNLHEDTLFHSNLGKMDTTITTFNGLKYHLENGIKIVDNTNDGRWKDFPDIKTRVVFSVQYDDDWGISSRMQVIPHGKIDTISISYMNYKEYWNDFPLCEPNPDQILIIKK
jgi:hypothetical protein